MIDTLDALPALTARGIAPLERDDPELHAELAGRIVVGAPGAPTMRPFPAEVGAVLAAVDLTDREIGAFRFVPVDEGDASARISAFDAMIRAQFDAPQGIGLFDMEAGGVAILAPDFTRFLIAQANAYDAFKRRLIRAPDLAAYEAERDRAAAMPALAGADVAAIFAIQHAG